VAAAKATPVFAGRLFGQTESLASAGRPVESGERSPRCKSDGVQSDWCDWADSRMSKTFDLSCKGDVVLFAQNFPQRLRLSPMILSSAQRPVVQNADGFFPPVPRLYPVGNNPSGNRKHAVAISASNATGRPKRERAMGWRPTRAVRSSVRP